MRYRNLHLTLTFDIALRPSVCRLSVMYVLWLNGASYRITRWRIGSLCRIGDIDGHIWRRI